MGSKVDCGRWKIHYSEFGKGKPLILLHGGAPASSGEESYAKNIDPLAERFKVYVIDFPGWGSSSPELIPSGEYANPMEVAGSAIVAFMSALRIPRAHLIGSSFGGAAALHVALSHPELVGSLILAAPAGGDTNGVLSPGLVKLLKYYDDAGPTFAKYVDLMSHMVYDRQSLTNEMLAAGFNTSNVPGKAGSFPLRLPANANQALPKALSGHPRLAEITAPVLFIWGREDGVQPVEALASFRRIPDQQSVILESCGHWSYWEHPQRFNEVALEFLA